MALIPLKCKNPIVAPYPTRPDWRTQTRSGGTRSSLSFPIQIQKKKKKIQYKCEYIFITKRISNTHWVYVKIYIKHFLRKAHHFGITPTFISSFTKFIKIFNIKNIYKIESEFNFHKILYTKKVNSISCICVRSFTSPPNGFDVGSVLVRSSLLYLFTRYLRVDKNNTLSIFMLSGSIQFYSLFISF